MTRTCATCGGMLLRDRVTEDLVCAICGRSLTGTREPSADEQPRVREPRGVAHPFPIKGAYGDELPDEARCNMETSTGQCRNPNKARGRCWLHMHRSVV